VTVAIACVLLIAGQERVRIESLQNRVGFGLKKSESAHLLFGHGVARNSSQGDTHFRWSRAAMDSL